MNVLPVSVTEPGLRNADHRTQNGARQQDGIAAAILQSVQTVAQPVRPGQKLPVLIGHDLVGTHPASPSGRRGPAACRCAGCPDSGRAGWRRSIREPVPTRDGTVRPCAGPAPSRPATPPRSVCTVAASAGPCPELAPFARQHPIHTAVIPSGAVGDRAVQHLGPFGCGNAIQDPLPSRFPERHKTAGLNRRSGYGCASCSKDMPNALVDATSPQGSRLCGSSLILRPDRMHRGPVRGSSSRCRPGRACRYRPAGCRPTGPGPPRRWHSA